jgi:hypothetical protein
MVTDITTGVIPASATTGMLVGYGLRAGGAGRVFSAIGATLVSTRTPALALVLGLLLHVGAMLACGLIYSWLVTDQREHRFAWALLVGAAFAAIVLVLTRAFGGLMTLVLTPGNLIALGVVTAITLPIGMRFAPSRV